MRVGTGPLGALAGEAARVSEALLEGVGARAAHAPAKVMMADSTVSDQSTFDPARVSGYFASVLNRLGGWQSDGVSESRNDGVRRAFAKFSASESGYVLSGHVSVQYHVLLHYRPDARVRKARAELAEVVDRLRPAEGDAAAQADAVVERKLREAGHSDPGGQEIFEALFNDEQLVGDIAAETGGDREYRELSARRQELVEELDSLLLETYQTSPVLIDEARLVAGEEGLVCAFDLGREGGLDGVPEPVLEWVRARLDEVRLAVVDVNREADTEEGLRGRSRPPDLS